jgi:hypothetical protein
VGSFGFHGPRGELPKWCEDAEGPPEVEESEEGHHGDAVRRGSGRVQSWWGTHVMGRGIALRGRAN